MSSVVKRIRTFTLRSKGYLKNVEARAEYNKRLLQTQRNYSNSRIRYVYTLQR